MIASSLRFACSLSAAGCAQVHTEFSSLDSRTFHTNQPNALATCFGAQIDKHTWNQEVHVAGLRLATVFTTLRSHPSSIIVRTPQDLPEGPGSQYRSLVCKCALSPKHLLLFPLVCVEKPTLADSRPNYRSLRGRLCRSVGEKVRDHLIAWRMKDASLFTGPACDLIVLDRASDPVAPLIHPFHYASAVHDIIPLLDHEVRSSC